MTTAKLDLLLPANYARLLKTELKDSAGAAVPLRYIYDRDNKQPAVVFVGDVGAGMVTLMKKEDSGIKVLIGKIAETEKAFLFEIGSQLTDKAMTVQLLDAGIRKPVLRVKDVDEALLKLKTAATPSKDETELTVKAQKAFDGLKTRLNVAKKWAADNHKTRLVAAIKEFDELVQKKSGKEAVATVLGLAKALQVIETTDLREPAELLERIDELEKLRDGIKNPALHPKNVKAISEVLAAVGKALDADKASDWKAWGKKLDEVQDELENAADLAKVFHSQRREVDDIEKEIKKLDRELVNRMPAKKVDLGKLEAEVKKQLKLAPTEIVPSDRYEPFADLIRAENDLLGFMREALKPATKADLSTVAGRKSVYAYDQSATWVMNPVVYKNGTSSSSMGSQQLDLLKKGLLRSNTIGGSVLKVGFEGHAHVDGGSGGVAFIYKLDDQYKVTPIVVDTASSRGNNKDKNKYNWDTGGLDYFPPNAKY